MSTESVPPTIPVPAGVSADGPTAVPNLQALALFVAVVDEGGLGAGARRLGIHQPNASRMIARLEQEAGTRLLDRHPSGARPTSAGLLYASHARPLVDAARAFGAWLAQPAGAGAGELRIGVSLTIAEHLVPRWLADLRRAEPELRVLPLVDNSSRVLEELRDGRVELGFIEGPQVPREVHALTLVEDELVVVVPPGHPWARRTNLSADELARTPLVVREGGSGTREALERRVPGAAATRPVQELGSNAAVRLSVAAGAGPAVLSRLAVEEQLRTGELVRIPLTGVDLRRPLRAVWTGPRRLTGAAARLVAVARAGTGERPPQVPGEDTGGIPGHRAPDDEEVLP